jgi:undecaprenyl-diphosphatase
MTLFQALILGIVQGLTEFLPISSSAHLVLVPFFLGWDQTIPADQIFPFGVLVQWGTLLAVILYFWKDLWTILKAWFTAVLHRRPFENADARMGWFIILATIPAGLFGLLIKNQVEAAFNSPAATGLFLLVTAALLTAAELLGKSRRDLTGITWLDALIIGLFQAVAIFPGVSRSGATITGGMLRGLERASAARFSFIMSIPVMLAAGLLSMGDLTEVASLSSFLPALLAGLAAAAVFGFLSIKWLLNFLRTRRLIGFAVYCALLGIATLIVSYV